MSADSNVALRLVPQERDSFHAHPFPSPVDEEHRREEARRLLVEFLVRHILAQTQVIEISGKAA